MGNLMLFFILFLFILFFSCGTYFLLAEKLNLPSLSATRAVLNVARQDKKQTRNFEAFIFEISSKLARYIKIDDYKKRKMEASLKSAGINLTPETFIARAWIKTGMVLSFIVPVLAILPILSPIIIFLAVTIYFKEIGRAQELLKEKRDAIEYELPRFASTVSQELKATRDVLSILSSYQKSAGDSLKNELEITIADMKSGNQETALTRFESRMGSTRLSDVVRGLITVIRGDNGVVYFQMLAHDFKILELQRLKIIAMKRPGKIRKYSFFMLGCFLLMYLVVLGVEIMNALGKMF